MYTLPSKNVTFAFSFSDEEVFLIPVSVFSRDESIISLDKASSDDLFKLLGEGKGGLEGKMFCLQRQALYNKRKSLTLV